MGQLTAVDSVYQTDETYTYDANGNRTLAGYTTGDNNQLTSDGTYDYEYDDEGNRTKKTHGTTGDYVEYTWDHRNRLTAVTFRDSSDVKTKEVTYVYDVYDRRIAKDVDDNGNGTIDRGERYVYDSASKMDPGAGVPLDDVVLVYDRSDNLVERLLHGPSIDQPLASEDDSGDVLWLLADNQGTIRDVAEYDAGTDTTTVVNHLQYDGFGQITAQSDSNYEPRHTYTGREWDADAELFYYRSRWYDPAVGRFISEDPLGFGGADANLSRYAGNATSNFNDASGNQSTPVQNNASLLYLYHRPDIHALLTAMEMTIPIVRPAQCSYTYTQPGVYPSHTSGAPTLSQTTRINVLAQSNNIPHTTLTQLFLGSGPPNTLAQLHAQYGSPPVTTLPQVHHNSILGVNGNAGWRFSNIPHGLLCGVRGAGPCAVVVIVSPPTATGVDVWAYHFGSTQWPARTLSRSGPFPVGSSAYLAGGDTGTVSAGTLQNAVNYLEADPNITVQGMVHSMGLWVDRMGTLYVHDVEVRLHFVELE